MDRYWKKLLTKNSLFIRSILFLLSQLYRLAYTIKFVLFETGILKKVKLSVPVISIGNLTVGGTGKTPLVIYITKLLKNKNKKISILSRGYGGKLSEGVVSNGKKIFLTPFECSDEAYLLADKLKVPVLIGKHRRFTGREAIEKFGADILILDDGYQYFRMIRDCNILVINAKDPFSNFKLLPSGKLREPITQLKRANIIILTKCDPNNNYNELKNIIRKYNPNYSLFTSKYNIDKFQCNNAHNFKIIDVADKNVLILCSIAEPEYFKELLLDEHLLVKKYEYCFLDDHMNYSKKTINNIIKKYSHCNYIFTTEKDIVKLTKMNLTIPIVYISIKLKIENEEKFKNEISKHCNIR